MLPQGLSAPLRTPRSRSAPRNALGHRLDHIVRKLPLQGRLNVELQHLALELLRALLTPALGLFQGLAQILDLLVPFFELQPVLLGGRPAHRLPLRVHLARHFEIQAPLPLFQGGLLLSQGQFRLFGLAQLSPLLGELILKQLALLPRFFAGAHLGLRGSGLDPLLSVLSQGLFDLGPHALGDGPVLLLELAGPLAKRELLGLSCLRGARFLGQLRLEILDLKRVCCQRACLGLLGRTLQPRSIIRVETRLDLALELGAEGLRDGKAVLAIRTGNERFSHYGALLRSILFSWRVLSRGRRSE